jgi:hypothetical protein
MSNALEENKSKPLRGVLSAWLSGGKTWWGTSLTVQILASLGAAVSVLKGPVSAKWALVLGVASIAGLLGRWRADSLRQRAESLLRQVELEDGFDWKVSPKIVADSLSRGIAVAKSAANRAREQANFYASSRQAGSLRALDNLRESAWWTQQNAQWMGWIAVWIVVVLCLVAVWSLLVAATVIGPPTALEVSRLLAAGISVVFAGNLVRLPFEYFRLANSASESDRKASDMIQANGSPTEADALRLLGDYQLARAMGPPIPDWVWRMRRDHLNEIWRQTRSDH